jgi:hypothetical protein
LTDKKCDLRALSRSVTVKLSPADPRRGGENVRWRTVLKKSGFKGMSTVSGLF